LEGLEVNELGDRRVLVTGATGMIGSWLVKELLGAGANVLALVYEREPDSELIRSGDIDRIDTVDGALQQYDLLEETIRERRVDTVFHLGAQTQVEWAYDDPLTTWESNVRGTFNLLEACRANPGLVQRIVVASSDKAYGDQDVLPYTEESRLAATYPYDVSKACADLIAQSYHQTYGLPVAVARCGNTFGGGDLNWNRIVPGTIRSLLSGEAPIVRSDGKYLRDYVYVKDVARAYMQLGSAVGTGGVAGQAFNFAHESPVSVLEVVDTIRRLMERDDLQPVIEDRAVGEIRDQWLSSEKARTVLGWAPGYDLESALAETIDWYRSYLG
jgi:CDP-glucose 4,6-dehydratase